MTTDRPSNEQTDEQATGLTGWSIPASHVLRRYLEAVRLGDPKEGWEVHEVHLVTAPRRTGAATQRVEGLNFNEVVPRSTTLDPLAIAAAPGSLFFNPSLKRLRELAERFGYAPVTGNDVHYVRQDDAGRLRTLRLVVWSNRSVLGPQDPLRAHLGVGLGSLDEDGEQVDEHVWFTVSLVDRSWGGPDGIVEEFDRRMSPWH